MNRMTRTQISLPEDQHEFLKATAAERGVSMSALVRDLVGQEMNRGQEHAPHVWELAGLIADSEISGRDHDRILYGEKNRSRDH